MPENSKRLLQLAAVSAGSVGFYIVVKKWLRQQKTRSLPRGYSTAKFIDDSQMPKHELEINRDGYSKKKVPKDLDAIVIGSGIGGLMCAATLSRAGRRVLVLEQHYIAGGATHCFEEGGVEFDTGIHYIGNIEKRAKYLDLVSETQIEWDKMGHEDGKFCYDQIRIGDGTGLGGEWKKYDLRAGVDEYIKEMVAAFPQERAAIEEYVRLCKEVSKKDLFFDMKVAKPAWLVRLLAPYLCKSLFKWTSRTALEVVSELTPNKDLQAALLAQFGDYGKCPSIESFFLHASVANHYFEGGWYPKGGTGTIAKALIPTVERTGGRVLVRRGVKEILLDDRGRACGVRMDGAAGDEIRAPMIISNAGALNTYKKLLPEASVPKGVREKMAILGPSCSMVYLFVGMKGTPEELKLKSSNIWHWPERDYDRMCERWEADPANAPLPMFAGFPCAKDSTWNKRFPGRSNAVILTLAKFEWFEQWEKNRQGARGEEYDKLKKQFEDRILEALYFYYPQTRGAVDYTLVGSPLTFNFYIGSQKGEVYGLESHPQRFQADDWLRPQTDVPGLYMTGQDVTTLGVTGALMSGILTAMSATGYGSAVDIASGRTIIEDLMHLDEQTGRTGPPKKFNWD